MRLQVAAKNAGCGFVFIDTEHVPIDREKLSWMCRTYSAMGMPPIVLVPGACVRVCVCIYIYVCVCVCVFVCVWEEERMWV